MIVFEDSTGTEIHSTSQAHTCSLKPRSELLKVLFSLDKYEHTSASILKKA